jgi:hypothetical protein
MRLPIAQGFYVSESLPLSAQECTNWYVNIPQTLTITEANLFGTPGLNQLETAGINVRTRGSGLLDSIPYFVIGDSLYRLDRTIVLSVESFTLVDISAATGVTIGGSGRVFIFQNETQLCIVCPDFAATNNAYIFRTGPDDLEQIDDPAFDGPVSGGDFIDGYFLFTKLNGKKFFQSPLSDGRGSGNGGAAYDALAFGTAEVDPDPIRGIITYRSQVFIPGSEMLEVFKNVGSTPFAFQRVSGFTMPKGLDAPFTLTEFQTSFVFIGSGKNEKPSIWRFNGNNLDKISTTAIDNALSSFTDIQISSAFSWVYAEDGAFFVGFTIGNKTFCYDDVTGIWHQRSSRFDNADVQFRVSTMVPAYGRVVVGDLADGRVGELRKDLYQEYGITIFRPVATRPFDNDGNPIFIRNIEAVMETGGGTNEEGGNIALSWSTNGARRFNNALPRTLGKAGEYIERPIWRQINRVPRSIVLRFEFSGNVKPTFLKLEADVD